MSPQENLREVLAPFFGHKIDDVMAALTAFVGTAELPIAPPDLGNAQIEGDQPPQSKAEFEAL
jgi:hypothetical protein